MGRWCSWQGFPWGGTFNCSPLLSKNNYFCFKHHSMVELVLLQELKVCSLSNQVVLLIKKNKNYWMTWCRPSFNLGGESIPCLTSLEICALVYNSGMDMCHTVITEWMDDLTNIFYGLWYKVMLKLTIPFHLLSVAIGLWT